MNLIEQKSRGAQAERVLQDELVQEALKELRYSAHRAFERSDSPEARERAFLLLETAKAFQRFFVLLVTQGKNATKQIDHEMIEGDGVIKNLVRRTRSRVSDDMPWSDVT